VPFRACDNRCYGHTVTSLYSRNRCGIAYCPWQVDDSRTEELGHGTLMPAAEGRERSTIRCLVYSRVVFQVLVLQIIGINSVRGGLASRYAVSLSSTPDVMASQQRWCDESYSPAHLRGLPKRMSGAETRPLPSNLGILLVEAAPYSQHRSTDFGRVRRSIT
jgi:hypothetical protein